MSGPLSVVEAEQLLGDILLDAEATSERHDSKGYQKKARTAFTDPPTVVKRIIKKVLLGFTDSGPHENGAGK